MINLILVSLLLLGAGQDFGLDPHLFQHPIDYAAAADFKKDTVISVSYGLAAPSRVCVGVYDLEDADFLNPQEQRCFVPPKGEAISLFVWVGKNIKDLGNILVTVYHQNGSLPTVMALVYRSS